MIVILICTIISFSSAYDVTILHTNDIHTRFEQFGPNGACSAQDSSAGNCYGGSARMMTKVTEIRSQVANTVFVDAGDMFHGTMWYHVYKGNASRNFMNLLKYDVMALGNHEFDAGLGKLSEFLKGVNFPVISANIDATKNPDFGKLFTKYTILTMGGEKIGFVGYTTRNTPNFSRPGPTLIFTDEIKAITDAVSELQNQGINKIVAVGHSGYDIDQQIAAKVCGIDAVVGAHTHTFLYTGKPPTNHKPAGPYPTVVKSECATESNKIVPVVQAYEFGRYLGRLELTFDDGGVLTSFNGKPILLDKSVVQDTALEQEVKRWQPGISAFAAQELGRSHVYIDGSRATCGLYECNMGNLLTDAMVQEIQRFPDSSQWANASIAILQAGDILASIDNKPPGIITISNMHAITKYDNVIDELTMPGSILIKALELGVANYNKSKPSSLFLQVSGLRVVYNLAKPSNERVHSVEVICTQCKVPRFVPMDKNKMYKVLAPSYIGRGFGGFSVFRDKQVIHREGTLLTRDASIAYIQARSPLITRLDGRISFLKASNTSPCTNNASGIKPMLILLFVMSALIQCVIYR
ncbi:uncharacterized protein TRIADDRAFT_32243 [Trichoplax adhaerens]|uniref:5'-nucleotidase n=1 Tax=Trichoplax adhaerens TaxID=10228 RepID=B3SAL2_TRIAD|nr:hypothetical protein TRIADDRAFT_32243 [Trichoplax adhaerens]EDV20332.1 hypothetical protein TRIADDRAFT_32243 [Trichoplax adhaerens]|eukprot:XP_002117282.1 hypothetical protein TRIADDRAFT_32243 [Trichoplax adhaerens]